MNAQIYQQHNGNQSSGFNQIASKHSKFDYLKIPVAKVNDYGVRVFINQELCDGCKLCLEECNEKVLTVSKTKNKNGFLPVSYIGFGCNGCGICTNVCQIDGAIRIFKRLKPK